MPYSGNIVELPLGRAGQTARENRLYTDPSELLEAQAIAFDDDYCRKAPGADKVNPDSTLFYPYYSATLAGASRWGAIVRFWRGSQLAWTGAAKTASVRAGAGTGAISLTVPAGGYAIGSLLVLLTSYQKAAGAGDSPASLAVTDTAGNTWVASDWSAFQVPTLPADEKNTRMFSTRVTSALSAGNSITVTYTGAISADNRVAIVAEWTGADSGTPDDGGNSESLTGSTDTAPHTRARTIPAATGDLPLGSPVETLPVLSVAGLVADQASSNTVTPGAGWTQAIQQPTNAAVPNLALSFRIDTGPFTIIAIHEFDASDRVTTLTGTVSTTAGSNVITGASTLFTTEIFAAGDLIRIGTETRKVALVASDTSLTTTEAWVNTNAGQTAISRWARRLLVATDSGCIIAGETSPSTGVFAFNDVLRAGLSPTARPGFFLAAGKEAAAVFRVAAYLNGVDAPEVIKIGTGVVPDFNSTASITPPSGTDWSGVSQPRGAIIHNNRVAAWGNINDPHRIYFSSPDDHGDFADALLSSSTRVAASVGERIAAIAEFQGVLFVWKYPRGLFYLDDSSFDTSEWVIRHKSLALGAADSPFAVLPIDDDIIFLSATGSFHVLTAVAELGGVRASDLSYGLGLSKWIRDNVNLSRLNQVVSVWYQAKKQAVFSLPSTGSTENDLTLVFDFAGTQRGLPVRFSYLRRDRASALATRVDTDGIDRPVFGEGGFVYRYDVDARTKNGAGYTSAFQTPHLDLTEVEPTLRTKRKIWDRLELIMEPVAAGTLVVEVYVDGAIRETLSFAATRRRQAKTLHVGDGHTISVRVRNAAAGEDFKVLALLLYFRVGNEDQSR